MINFNKKLAAFNKRVEEQKIGKDIRRNEFTLSLQQQSPIISTSESRVGLISLSAVRPCLRKFLESCVSDHNKSALQADSKAEVQPAYDYRKLHMEIDQEIDSVVNEVILLNSNSKLHGHWLKQERLRFSVINKTGIDSSLLNSWFRQFFVAFQFGIRKSKGFGQFLVDGTTLDYVRRHLGSATARFSASLWGGECTTYVVEKREDSRIFVEAKYLEGWKMYSDVLSDMSAKRNLVESKRRLKEKLNGDEIVALTISDVVRKGRNSLTKAIKILEHLKRDHTMLVEEASVLRKMLVHRKTAEETLPPEDVKAYLINHINTLTYNDGRGKYRLRGSANTRHPLPGLSTSEGRLYRVILGLVDTYDFNCYGNWINYKVSQPKEDKLQRFKSQVQLKLFQKIDELERMFIIGFDNSVVLDALCNKQVHFSISVKNGSNTEYEAHMQPTPSTYSIMTPTREELVTPTALLRFAVEDRADPSPYHYVFNPLGEQATVDCSVTKA